MYLQNLKKFSTISAQIISQKVNANSPLIGNYITDSNKTFYSRGRGSVVDSDSWLVVMTPGDSDSDSDSALLMQGLRHVFRIWGTGTGGAKPETGPETHLSPKFRFSSDFVYFILEILKKKHKKMKKNQK